MLMANRTRRLAPLMGWLKIMLQIILHTITW